ncbi:MAG TPA: glutamate--tRNA ligase [Actinomycetota bacterium]|nr:glutamate--tRNA ligase [Actinomycetota bacterium]
MSDVVRTRIAPAPSGSIHVGNARAALYNWLFSRQRGGVFVLRIEDTDQKRANEGAYAAIEEDLEWLGLSWDEGPFLQSERLDNYAAAAARLVEAGSAYRCYCTPEELDARRKAATAAGRPPGYDGRCRDLTSEERAAFEAEGRTFALRFRVPENRTIAFDDVVRGPVATETAQISDFIIQRSDGFPTYMLAVTVDDLEMDITHVIRGEDLLASTPRQLLIREALGVDGVPVFAHLPLLVSSDGRPLSKRWGDVSVRAYRDAGFLPEAMVNYLALLGWSFDDHTNVFSIDELVEKFSLERVGRNPAAFDVVKLEWLNGIYIKQLPPSDLAERLVPFCVRAGIDADSAAGRKILTEVAPLISERLKRLDEAPSMIRFLFGQVTLDEKALRVVQGQAEYLGAVADRLAELPEWSTTAIESALRELASQRGLKPKQAFQPIRAAVTGTLVSPPLFESLAILSKDTAVGRLRAAPQTVVVS